MEACSEETRFSKNDREAWRQRQAVIKVRLVAWAKAKRAHAVSRTGQKFPTAFQGISSTQSGGRQICRCVTRRTRLPPHGCDTDRPAVRTCHADRNRGI